MIKKSYIFLLILFLVHYSLFMADCYARAISSTELINNAKLYNGKTIAFEGEVVGDIMIRGKYAWMNVNDGKNALGVWIDKDLAKEVIYTGSYKHKGDLIEVTGVFARACLEHGGDLDIHAQAIRKIGQGRANIEKLDTGKRNLSLVLLGVLCLIWILSRLKVR